MRERNEFVRQEAERERLEQDQIEYQKHRNAILNENRSLPPADHVEPLTFEAFRAMMPPEESDPALRAAIAVNRALVHQQAELEREAIANGKGDPGFQLPESVAGKRATVEQAKQINRAEFRRFKDRNAELYFSAANVDTLTDYLTAQNVSIADAETYETAWLRLQSFGLLEEPPAPEPAPEPEQPQIEPEPEQVDDGSMIGIDPLTGLERRYTAREIGRMTSYEFKRAFDLNLERRLAAWDELIVAPNRY